MGTNSVSTAVVGVHARTAVALGPMENNPCHLIKLRTAPFFYNIDTPSNVIALFPQACLPGYK